MDQALINLAAAAPELIFGVLVALICIYMFRTTQVFMTQRDEAWTVAMDAREVAGQAARAERDQRWRDFFDIQREKDRAAGEQLSLAIRYSSDQTVQALTALIEQIRRNTDVLTRHDEAAQSLHGSMYEITKKALGNANPVPKPARKKLVAK